MEQIALAEDEVPEEEEEDGRLYEEKWADFDKGLEFMEELGGKPALYPERAGINSARPPLSKAAQRTLCKRIGAKAKVLYDHTFGPTAAVTSSAR